MRDARKIPLQQLPPFIPQFLDEVQRIEDGEEHVLFAEHLRKVGLSYVPTVEGKHHTVVLPRAEEDMILPVFIHEVQ